MRASCVRVPGSVTLRRILGCAWCSGLLVLGARAAAPATAAAHEELTAPEYSISVVEGVTTVPEDSILSTSGSVHLPHQWRAPITLRIVHGGLTVAQDTESEGGAWLSQVPQVGDIVYLESPAGNIVGSVVYDGQPAMDPTVCAGSTNFSGQRSAGEEVEGAFETLVVHPNYVAHRRGGQAQVTSLTGTTFGGNFLTPLEPGETVSASEHLRTTLAGGATFTYTSETVRPVGACPLPPAPPPPPPLALQGSIFKLVRTTLHRLLRSGWVDQVTINQPGAVTQDLYEAGGSTPAHASAAHRRGHHKRPAVLLARGSASAAAAGEVRVVLHATRVGRRVLGHRGRVRAELVTTLKATSGATLNLPARAVTLGR